MSHPARLQQIIDLLNDTLQAELFTIDTNEPEPAAASSENTVLLHRFNNIAIYGRMEDKVHLPLLTGLLSLEDNLSASPAPNLWLTYLTDVNTDPPASPQLDRDKTYCLCHIGNYDTHAIDELLQLASEVLVSEVLYSDSDFTLLLMEAHPSLAETLSAFYESAALELGQMLSLYLSAKALNVEELPEAYKTIKALEKLMPADSAKTPVFFEAHLSELLFDEWLSHKPGSIFRAIRRQNIASHLDEETLRTIDMLFQMNLNLTDTARALFIHRNTLIYRLDKIEKQLGFDLRRFEDCFQLKLLLRIK